VEVVSAVGVVDATSGGAPRGGVGFAPIQTRGDSSFVVRFDICSTFACAMNCFVIDCSSETKFKSEQKTASVSRRSSVRRNLQLPGGRAYLAVDESHESCAAVIVAGGEYGCVVVDVVDVVVEEVIDVVVDATDDDVVVDTVIEARDSLSSISIVTGE
jgi:hypothetical protein